MDIKPEIGMGVTEYMYSDRHAYTIIEIKNHRRITVQKDKAVRIDSNGMSDSQHYEYTPDPEGYKYELSRRKDGAWRIVGSSNGDPFIIGHRREYYDYSF